MKKAAVALVVLAALLAFALYRTRQSAAQVVTRGQADVRALTNRVAELEMKLNHQERLAAASSSQLTNCTDALNQRAAELAGLRTAISRAESGIRQARSELETAARARQQFDSEIASLKSRIAELESALAEAEVKVRFGTEQLQVLSTERNEVMLQLAQMRHEYDRLRARLSDPSLLQAELGALRRNTSATNRAEALWPPKQQVSFPRSSFLPTKSPSPLELLPDGSVQAAPAD